MVFVTLSFAVFIRNYIYIKNRKKKNGERPFTNKQNSDCVHMRKTWNMISA